MNSKKDNFIQKKRMFYFSIGFIICPAFRNEKVYFNKHGFNHLFRKRGNIRPKKEIMGRLGLLEKAIQILQNSDSIFEHKTSLEGMAVADFWAFVKKYEDVEIKVIVRKVGNGRVHFFSVYAKK